MPKQPPYNRLKTFFSSLTATEPTSHQAADGTPINGWAWECNQDGVYTSCTHSVLDCLGRSADEFIGQSIYDFAIPLDSQRILKTLIENFSTPEEIIISYQSSTGEFLPTRINLIAVRGPDGTSSGFQGLCQLLGSSVSPFKDAISTVHKEKQIELQSSALLPHKLLSHPSGLPLAPVPETHAAALSLKTGQTTHQQADLENPAAIAVPLKLGDLGPGVIEIIKDHSSVPWTRDEIMLVQEVATQLSLALENAQLYSAVQQELTERIRAEQKTQEALSESEKLYSVSAGIARSSTVDDLISLLVETCLPSAADRVSISLIRSDSNGNIIELEVVGIYDLPNDYHQSNVRIPILSIPLINQINNDPIVIPDVPNSGMDPESKLTLTNIAGNSVCIVPLHSAGHLIGTITVSAKRITSFDPDEIRILTVAAGGIAVSLERQRLLGEAQRRALELQTAAEIARDTISTLSLDTLLERIVNLLQTRFSFYHVAIFLIDDDGHNAVIREASGNAGAKMKADSYQFNIGSKTVVGKVCSTGNPVILSDVSNSDIFHPYPLLEDTKSEVGVPLKLSEKTIGVLDIQSITQNAFTSDDILVLQILADQIAIAIDNARSYELSQLAVEEMKEVDRMKSQFLANMSHELRTPLNSIIGFSRVIIKGIDGPINDLQQQDLNAIYNSGQHLLNLINDILDLSRLEAGKMELNFELINMGDLINSVMSTAVGLVKDKPIKLISTIEPDLPVVSADQTRIRQVLLNLISNATKFTEKGSITVEAKSSKSSTGQKEITINVTDTGNGIAVEDRPKLFQPFSQVDDSPTRKTGGSGLGLSICRSLIEMHGGNIGLGWSEIGKGSTFYFTLPLKEENQKENDDIGTGKPIILAIDDDLQVLNLYRRYLGSSGYNVIPLSNPTHAVEQAELIKPFAITLDIMMPEMDGWQVLHALKNNPSTRDIPIIICSILEDDEKGFSLGAADYLVKPFLQDELMNAINRLNSEARIREILVVDDDSDDQRLMKKLLEETGVFHVTQALNGDEAINSIKDIRPDAIILDLFMPGMDGFALLEKLRTDPEFAHLPVLVLTGADLTPEQHQTLTRFGQQLLSKGYVRDTDILNALELNLKSIRS